MSRFDRYLLWQLLALFGFFALILVAVTWINRAVLLFEQLIGDGQSALVFLEISMLTLPSMISIVLPIAAFAGTVYVTNRLTSESELVVMQATGFSAFRLARPVLFFGMIVALMSAILLNVLVPAARAQLVLRNAEIAQNATARFLNEGQFNHPTKGMTLYIREIDDQGTLRDLFIADARAASTHRLYSARQAFILKSDDGPKLLMFDGTVQILQTATNQLSTTKFEDFTYDLAGLIPKKDKQNRTFPELPTVDLLWPSPAILAETGNTAQKLLFEGHTRLAEPLHVSMAGLIGFATLLIGAFSRFGLWRQIMAAIAFLAIVQATWTITNTAGETIKHGWLLLYLSPVLAATIAGTELYIAQNPRLWRNPLRKRAAA